jgi:hypothetical protein
MFRAISKLMMRKRFIVVLCLALAGLSLGACSKCGFFWDEMGRRACHADTAPR